MELFTARYPGLTWHDARAIARRRDEMRRNAGETFIGYKLGWTSAAMREALGIDRPNWGTLWASQFTGEDGSAVMVSNHGGLLPFDGAMTAVDVFMHTDPPRLARSIVDLWAGKLPFVNVAFARLGQVIGTSENFTALLDEGHFNLVETVADRIARLLLDEFGATYARVSVAKRGVMKDAGLVGVSVERRR